MKSIGRSLLRLWRWPWFRLALVQFIITPWVCYGVVILFNHRRVESLARGHRGDIPLWFYANGWDLWGDGLVVASYVALVLLSLGWAINPKPQVVSEPAPAWSAAKKRAALKIACYGLGLGAIATIIIAIGITH